MAQRGGINTQRGGPISHRGGNRRSISTAQQPDPAGRGYCPNGGGFQQLPLQQQQNLPFQQPPFNTQQVTPSAPLFNRTDCPTSIQDLWTYFCGMHDEFQRLRSDHNRLQDDSVGLQQEIYRLNGVISLQNAQISKLEANIDSLDQYSRRENVCFTNLLVDSAHTCEDQVINMCGELGVTVTSDDFVATHPLPSKKGKPSRYIARFKNRSTAQKVFQNRKMTKNIDPEKKKTLFADASKGVAVQPNITAKRAALMGQVKDAAEQFNLDSFWVDPKNCNVMLRVTAGGRPSPILNTRDLMKCAPQFVPRDYLLCADPHLNNNATAFSP